MKLKYVSDTKFEAFFVKKCVGFLFLLIIISCDSKQRIERNLRKDSIYEKKEHSEDSNRLEILQVDKLVKLGNQVWLIDNLNTSLFRNGDSIYHAKTKEEWENAGRSGKPAWCYYGNSSENGFIYGKLYNWYAVNDERGLAPTGWRIPNEKDWQELIRYLGGLNVVSLKLMSRSGWKHENGMNESGFNSLPSGGRFYNAEFDNILTDAYYWSSTHYEKSESGSDAICFIINYHLPMLTAFPKSYGLSIRCIRE
jgi:uncharacterized protein (TIGR02145 family)